MDLKITQARLAGRVGLWDIGIEGDRISAVAPALSTSVATVIDAAQKLVIPGLVDGHIHLDKALILDRHPAVEGTFQEAMRGTLRLKQTFTEADIQARARQVLQRAIAFGITAMRSHVEVDHTIGLTGLRALLPLRQEFAWGITLQLAAFAQEGITNQPGVEALLREAMTLGADVIGSAPYVDPDPEQNIRIVFDIAEAFNCDVDFHLDFLDDDAPLLWPVVAAETARRGWRGRVCLGHMTKLAGLSPTELAEAAAMREAGISILALPASDLYMMSRKDTHNVRRGVAPVHTLAAMGVNTGLAVNNIQNLFTPFGDGDVLKIGTLLAQVLQMGTAQAHELCLDMATTRAARAIGIQDQAIAPGHRADLVILDAASATEAIAAPPANRTVLKHGRIVAQTKLERQLFCRPSE
ncbi:amidohydrolase family protein [Thermoleptolyngbya sp. C42_A2020_037]|uniref:amidohydrolase family protein n=1 Tax=Thermoleptolyngbya sp. C42_A2020_037 TaxID=2747799 RepID=UPI0019F80288|nr:amidohydrolase family protein [Thermoleptolyngbya sp. C42_A2020_037]MBF2083721.1 amidohydrolase family protein [Thermoleptolyngbya sp. C42_A2020_037]